MLNQGLQSRRSGIKGPPVWARGPPRSRAPFTFVKEINLPLLSAGRGQSGRKRDACCRPGGRWGQSVLRGRLRPRRGQAASPLATRKRQQRRSTHSQPPTHHPGSPVWTQIGPFAFILFPAQPQGNTKGRISGGPGQNPKSA